MLFHFLLSFPHVILTLGARKPISHPNTLMKPFTRFCFAFSRTEGSEHSPTRLCQLAPFWKEPGFTTSERKTEQNKGEMRSGRIYEVEGMGVVDGEKFFFVCPRFNSIRYMQKSQKENNTRVLWYKLV